MSVCTNWGDSNSGGWVPGTVYRRHREGARRGRGRRSRSTGARAGEGPWRRDARGRWKEHAQHWSRLFKTAKIPMTRTPIGLGRAGTGQRSYSRRSGGLAGASCHRLRRHRQIDLTTPSTQRLFHLLLELALHFRNRLMARSELSECEVRALHRRYGVRRTEDAKHRDGDPQADAC